MLINRYTYNKNHGISFHNDIKEGYDVDKDPITSFSCRLGSLLVIISSTAPEKQEKTEGKRAFVVYQPPGTILVMGGKFQRAYKHGVPSFQEIKELLACADDLTTWDGVKLKLEWFSNSKDLMRQEVRRIDSLNLVNEQDARWNVTMRWVRNHSQPFCPLNPRLLANISRLDEENHQRRNQLKQLKLLNPVLQKKTAEPKAKAASPAFAWNPPGGNRARPSKSGTQDVNPGRETEEKESEKDSEKELNEIFDFVSIISDALELQILSDDQMMDMALCGSQQIRKHRFSTFQEQYNLGYNLYNKISAANMRVKEDLDPLLKAVDRKLRRLKNLQMLIELLWLDSEGQGNFMSCTTLNQQHEFNKSNDHLNRVVMSFFDLNECLTVDGFLFWDHMIEEGWLVFNFDTLQDNRKPKAEVTKSKKGSPVVADVTMTGIVKVSQFDILYIKRENILPEQFPLRVTFLADASKNVAAKCKDKQSLSSQEQLKLWMQQLMNFVAELEEEKGFSPLLDRKGFMKTCKIVLWTLPLSDALEYKNKKQKKASNTRD